MVRRIVAVLAVAAAIAGLGSGSGAHAAPTWGPAEAAPIRPGVQLVSPAGQCTANFVFTEGAEVYLGFAAHCVGTGGSTDLNGCSTGSHPLGTPVSIEGATRPGALVYSSWLAMQAAGEDDAVTCIFNDFALVRVDPADHQLVNPTVPHWGGPTGLGRAPLPVLSAVYGFGNSRLRGGIEALKPKVGIAVEEIGGSWTHSVFALTPGIPGDSGSALLDRSGAAVGIASSIGILPRPLANNYSDLAHAYDYARAHGHPGLRLAVGTEPFTSARGLLG